VPRRTSSALLTTTCEALRRVSLCPWRIGVITAAALVLLHRAQQHMITTQAEPFPGMAHWAPTPP
jgi:hypothetical protein